MNNKEAIWQLNSLIENSKSFHEEDGDIWEQDIEALNIAKQALEKQIPKKPLHESLADRFCPVCGAYINFDALNESAEEAPKFCSGCGQALYWGDTQ